MTHQKNIELEVNATINALDNITSAHPKPFLYGRIKNRLEKKQLHFWDKVAMLIANPAFALTTVALVLAMDGFIFFKEADTPITAAENSVSAQYIEFYDTNEEFYTLTYDDMASTSPQ